jgi:hypothetical protein
MRALPAAAAVAALLAAPAHGAVPRSTADRPDDRLGHQIHVVYAVPADGEDRRLDETGTLSGSISSLQAWLASETGGRSLRFDTFQGQLDVSFVRLVQTDAAIASQGAFAREAVQEGVRAAGFSVPDRIYAVYYDGSSTYACGGAFWPPQLPGSAVAMYLRGRPGGVDCAANSFAAAGEAPRYWEYAMLHDLVHGLGLVATCAPNHHLAGHVSDASDDLMWAGNEPWRFPARLDVGRDDYYGHGRTDCPDLARSPYLSGGAPAPAPTLRVTLFTATAVARAGKVVEAVMRVAVGGASPRAGTARCSARLGRAALRPLSATFRAGTARCRWRLPAASRGKRLSATVRATAGGLTASRTFARTVR